MFGDHEAISTVWPLVSHLNSMVSFYRYLFRRLLCSLCEIEDPCAAARFAVGLADRLLAVYLVQFVRLAAKRLVGKSLQLRKKYAGLLLLLSIQLEAKSDLGKGCHTRSTEPYFYEAAYLYVRDSLSLSLVTRPHPQEGERVWYITSEFLVVLSQHIQKTGNPIRLLDLLKSCDMKEN